MESRTKERISESLVITGGFILMFFGLFHASFWVLFDWKNELLKLDPQNGNIMQMLNVGMIFMLISMGILLIYFRRTVIDSSMGRAFLIILSMFFLIRLIEEFIFPGGTILTGLILLVSILVYLIPAVWKYSDR